MHPDNRLLTTLSTVLLTAALAGGCAASRSIGAGDAEAEDSTGPPAEHRLASRFAERHFTDGSLLQMRERHIEAIAEYRRALRFDTSRGAIYYAIGKSFRQLNEIDSAIHYTERAARHGGGLDVHEQLADLLMLSGDLDGAIAQYDSMLAIDPDHLQSRYMAARLLQRRDPARATGHFEYILRNLTDDTDVMLRLAELYLDAGNEDGAIEMMERMLALEPTSSELHQMMTTLLLDAGRHAAALELLRAVETRLASGPALESFFGETLREVEERLDGVRPGDSLTLFAQELVARASASARSWNVRLLAGDVALGVGDSARAEALFARALGDSTATAQTWAQIAGTFLDRDDPVTGLRIVAPTVERFADDFRVLYLFGVLHDAAGKTDTAVAWLRRSVAAYDDQAEAWAALARIYAAQGKVGASDAAYEKSISLDPENGVVLNNFAYALARRGSRLDRALELVSMALSYEPENESFLDTRGWVHFRRGELDEALEYLMRAVAAGGASAEVYEHLGDVHKARGDNADARTAYEHAAKLEPDRYGLARRLESVR